MKIQKVLGRWVMWGMGDVNRGGVVKIQKVLGRWVMWGMGYGGCKPRIKE